MTTRWRRVSWIAALVTGVVGLLTTIAGLLNAYPLVDFGTDEDKAGKVHGQHQHQLELGCLLLVLAVAALLAARYRGSAAALAGCTLSAALLAADTGTRHNLTLPARVSASQSTNARSVGQTPGWRCWSGSSTSRQLPPVGHVRACTSHRRADPAP